MAKVISGSFGSPQADYELHAERTSGSGNKRTIKITLKLKLHGSTSASKYGYPLNWKGRIHSSYSGWEAVKSSSAWVGPMGWKSFTWTKEVDVGTSSSKSITVGFELDSPGFSSSWEVKKTGTYNVGSTNVAPSTPSSITIRPHSGGGALNGIINERQSYFHIDWAASSDGNKDTIYYDLQEQINGGGWKSIDGSGTDTAHGFNNSGGEGTSYRYCVQARDKHGAKSEWRYSGTITKNRFTMATLDSNSSVSYSGNPLTFTYSGGSNTQSGVGITYSISCNEVTVYNGNNFPSGGTVKFNWGQAGGTSGAYINWSDVVNYFRATQGKGNLSFVLTGANSNGSYKKSMKMIPVNIQTSPGGAGNPYISTNSGESTCYKRVSSNGNYYFIPDGSGRVRVKWGGVSGGSGDTINYKVFVSNSGGWYELGTTSNTYFDHVIHKQTTSHAFKYLVRSYSSFNSNLYTDKETSAQTLHYYNAPSLGVSGINRTSTEATVNIYINLNTSLPGTSVKGSWSCNGKSGNLSSNSTQAIKITGLSENGSYNLSITYNDNTGLSQNKTETVSISANKPVFFVNKYGIGVGGAKATTNTSLYVSGALGQNAGTVVNFDSCLTEGEYYVAGNSLNGAPYSENLYGKLIVKVNDGHTHNNSNNWIWQYFMNTSGDLYRRNKTNSGSWSSWNAITSENSNPTFNSLRVNGKISCNGIASSIDIPSGANLNTYKTEGSYHQDYNAGAEAGKNYPVQKAGHLTVTNSAGTQQRYFVYNTQDIYIRSVYQGDNWTPWAKIPSIQDDGVMEIGRYIDFHHSGDKDYDVRIDCQGDKKLNVDGSLHEYGRRVQVQPQKKPLWSGYKHMSDSEKINPDKRLSQCQNGWILVWSDFNEGGTGQDYNYVYSYVPNNSEMVTRGANTCFALSTGEGDHGYTNKTLYFWDNEIKGHNNNKKDKSYDVVLRQVLEY